MNARAVKVSVKAAALTQPAQGVESLADVLRFFPPITPEIAALFPSLARTLRAQAKTPPAWTGGVLLKPKAEGSLTGEPSESTHTDFRRGPGAGRKSMLLPAGAAKCGRPF